MKQEHNYIEDACKDDKSNSSSELKRKRDQL